MKSLKMILTAAVIMASATPAVAQFANAGGGSSASNIDVPESYSILSVGYENMKMNPKYGDGMSTNGVALQYTSGSKIMADMPLYLEWGIRASLGFWSDSFEDYDYDDYDYEEIDAKLTTLSATVPVSVGYRLPIGETAAFTPYTGLHFRGNIVATLKGEAGDESESTSMFDKDLGKDAQWTRFQFGWQIGGRVSFNSFHIGLEYGLDFNELCKKTNTSYFQATIGFNI